MKDNILKDPMLPSCTFSICQPKWLPKSLKCSLLIYYSSLMNNNEFLVGMFDNISKVCYNLTTRKLWFSRWCTRWSPAKSLKRLITCSLFILDKVYVQYFIVSSMINSILKVYQSPTTENFNFQDGIQVSFLLFYFFMNQF